MDRKIQQYERRFRSVKNLQVVELVDNAKRFRATFELDGKKRTIRFGQVGGFTYFDGAPRKKMLSYKARASKITNKMGDYTYLIPGSANSLAYWLLWN